MEEALKQLQLTLSSLKDFQLATVKRVIENFELEKHSQRLLVADEVGLGKTIVAKGVIARLLIAWIKQYERGDVCRPMRVTYICSNLTLAAENCQKLAVFDHKFRERYVQEPSFGRLIELAVKPKQANSGKILEVCSLTPSTSFTLTQGDGNMRERYILYRCLSSDLRLEKYRNFLSLLFQNGVKDDSWAYQTQWFESVGHLDQCIVDDFIVSLDSSPSVPDEAMDFLELEQPPSSWINYFDALGKCSLDMLLVKENSYWLYKIRMHVRQVLARSCARNIQADLFILDEFQRFKALLDTDIENEQALIANEVFSREGKVKTLLLSATPFKAMSRIEDDESQDAHHEELQHLLTFLMDDDKEKLQEYEQARKALLCNILSLRDPSLNASDLDQIAKVRVEQSLIPFISRTERAQVSENFDNVYRQQSIECFETFTGSDIRSYQGMMALSQAVDKVHQGRQGHYLLEFYKSAPWPLSFMSGYQFKKRLDQVLDKKEIRSALNDSEAAWLQRKKVNNYSLNLANDTPHAKTRSLVNVVFSDRSEELLWMPPSAPHYPLEGCYKNNEQFSKTLLFSSWAMVPRALSGLFSYEAERRLVGKSRKNKKNYFRSNKHKPQPLIRFEGTAGLTGWSLVYPSKTLIGLDLPHNIDSLDALVSERTMFFDSELKKLSKFTEEDGSRKRRSWYAIAGMLLDRENGYENWLTQWLEGEFSHAEKRSDNSGRLVHLETIKNLLAVDSSGPIALGPMPNDLAEYLALLSISAPGICAARTFRAVWKIEEGTDPVLESRVGMAIVQMFNKPEATSVIRKGYQGGEYWREVLKYCVSGDLQAVLDEYAHLLKDSGLTVAQATSRLMEVTGLMTSTVNCQFADTKHKPSSRKSSESTLRCHYAIPFGNQKATDDKGQQRIVHVRDAFNSPFKPFVLISTSIGQEGLDFHWYCSRVVHWNLPSNPIDIEQREGRVNRYKSLVVRRRVAEAVSELIKSSEGVDYWDKIFKLADEATSDRTSDLVPYWHMPSGTAQIERVVPMMPMSREVRQLDEVLKILSLYRLAFGQPRQEELIENLLRRDFDDSEVYEIKQNLVINLSPLDSRH